VVNPLWTVRYKPSVDDRNTAHPGAASTVPLTLDVTEWFTPPKVKKVQVQASGDEGKTWLAVVAVRADDRNCKAVFPAPARAKSVSLRTHVVDADGNTTDQTTIVAYVQR
jgi:hypothetical protein